jgi:hypothetical protein
VALTLSYLIGFSQVHEPISADPQQRQEWAVRTEQTTELLKGSTNLLRTLNGMPGTTATLLFSAYMLPWLVAIARDAIGKGGVFVLDLLLGWTFIGWVVALSWALGGAKHVSARPVRELGWNDDARALTPGFIARLGSLRRASVTPARFSRAGATDAEMPTIYCPPEHAALED